MMIKQFKLEKFYKINIIKKDAIVFYFQVLKHNKFIKHK